MHGHMDVKLGHTLLCTIYQSSLHSYELSDDGHIWQKHVAGQLHLFSIHIYLCGVLMHDCTSSRMRVCGMGSAAVDRMNTAKDQVQLARSCRHGHELRTS